VEAYEGLRRQVVEPDGRVDHLEGRGIFLRSGLAAWSRFRPANLWIRPSGSGPQCTRPSPVHDSHDGELVRLVASLILSIRLEDVLHA